MVFLQSYLSVPPNLAVSLDVRKRSVVMTYEKKKGGIRTFVSPRVRSDTLWLLRPDVTGDGLTLGFVCTSYLGLWRSLCDRAFGLIASLAFPEPPRVVGIRSRAGWFCDCRPIRVFRNQRG